MGRIQSQIESEEEKLLGLGIGSEKKPFFKDGDVYRVEPAGTGPVMRKLSANEYRKRMAAQGIFFGKVQPNG